MFANTVCIHQYSNLLQFSTSTVTLSVRSTYTQPVQVMSLDIAPSSDGHHPVPITLPQELPAIAPNALTKVAAAALNMYYVLYCTVCVSIDWRAII